MHILLPPSEGKAAPARGPMLSLESLSFPELNAAREKVLAALIEVSGREDAAKILKVGAKGAKEIEAQRGILRACCAPAREVYTGVLYEAAQLRQGDEVLIFSGLFGVTRGEDPIPSYRLAMGVSLPGIGPLKTFWRKELEGWNPNGGAGENQNTESVTVDLRSEVYRTTKPGLKQQNGQWWDVRIADSQGKTVSHMAKHYRGLLARALLDAPGQPVDQVARSLGRVQVEEKNGVRSMTLIPEGI